MLIIIFVSISSSQQCPIDGATGEQLVYNPSIGRCDKPVNVPSCNTGK